MTLNEKFISISTKMLIIKRKNPPSDNRKWALKDAAKCSPRKPHPLDDPADLVGRHHSDLALVASQLVSWKWDQSYRIQLGPFWVKHESRKNGSRLYL